MKLTSKTFRDGAEIPARCAFAKPDARTHVALSDNLNPELSWSELPSGTQSLVLLCHDSDAPTRPDHVNKEGVTVPASLPRADFAHWVLVDLRPSPQSIAEGAFSSGVTPRGKPGPVGQDGTRHGLNSYTQWFEADKDMSGFYYGYDGPCPPWNDELAHHYHFTLYALDVARCAVEGGDGPFTRGDVLRAIAGHVLAQASIVGTYSLNPNLR
jgi:Raf kinase inhibitor-like YbhB/YbcL family protein